MEWLLNIIFVHLPLLALRQMLLQAKVLMLLSVSVKNLITATEALLVLISGGLVRAMTGRNTRAVLKLINF